MPKTKTVYFCRLCGSDRIQGTLPVWHRVNDPGLEQMDTDLEADYAYGFCEACEEADDFDALVKREEVPTNPE